MKNKRFRVFLDSGKHYDFGLDTGSTFIDHGDNKKRNAYIARLFGNRAEKQLIENLVPSPAFLVCSCYGANMIHWKRTLTT